MYRTLQWLSVTGILFGVLSVELAMCIGVYGQWHIMIRSSFVVRCKTWLLGVVTLYNVIVTVWSFHGFLAELSSPDCH